eukprot:m.746958 g.746958  ORF g.746958 m.746958 type:complete len:76 (+) comp58960_c0_seq62:690-917(+)
MLMALHLNQYDVTATIAWKERELDLAHRYGDVPVSALRDTMALFTRAETSLALSSIARFLFRLLEPRINCSSYLP